MWKHLAVITGRSSASWSGRVVDPWNERAEAALHAQVLAQSGDELPSGSARVAAAGFAILIDLTTLGLALLGVWIMWVTPFRIGGILVGALLVLLAWDVRPRLERLPSDQVADHVPDAPVLMAYLADVAAGAGTRPVDAVYVTAAINAGVFDAGLRRRRVLVIGAPLWAALTPGQRTAVLAHELGHFVNGDTRRGTLVGGAISTLVEWRRLLVDRRTVGLETPGGLIGLATWLTRWLLRIVSIVPGAAARALFAITRRDSRRAEYRADRTSARVAGRQDTLGGLQLLLRARGIDHALQRASIARTEDVLAAAAHFAQTQTSASEAEGPISAFDSHPPATLRIEAVEHLPDTPSTISLSPAQIAAMDAELAPALGRAARRLRDSYL